MLRKTLAITAMAGVMGSGAASAQDGQTVTVEVWKPELTALIEPQVTLEKVASGFGFTEGATWVNRDGGYLLFADIPANVIYRWSPTATQAEVFLHKTGYQGVDGWRVGMPFNNGKAQDSADYETFNLLGSNGNTLDPEGRLVIAAWAGRAIVRVEHDGSRTQLADRYQGKRFGGPNDLVVHRNGDVYFTDTFGGMLKLERDASREIDHNAVYRIHNGQVLEVLRDMPNVNGLAFSVDESVLYVTGSGDNYIRAYPVHQDGTVGAGRMFADLSQREGAGITDGMRVDAHGNVWTSGPGGLYVISPEGLQLGFIPLPELATNLEFGGADGRTLYITTPTSIYRLATKIGGAKRF